MRRLELIEAILENAQGRAPILLTCEHATNFIPPEFEGLGLPEAALSDHVAWDIGALALARCLALTLEAPLVAAPASRLLIDPNRAFDAADLVPETAEGISVPGNVDLSAEERAARIDAYHAPFHRAIETILATRPDIVALVSVHSFTPQLFGQSRPWHAGILHGADARLADVMIEVLQSDAAIKVGRNEPYAPEHGVFYTMDRHAAGRATVMIEVRNDLIRDEAGQLRWSQSLAGAVEAAVETLGAQVRNEGRAY